MKKTAPENVEAYYLLLKEEKFNLIKSLKLLLAELIASGKIDSNLFERNVNRILAIIKTQEGIECALATDESDKMGKKLLYGTQDYFLMELRDATAGYDGHQPENIQEFVQQMDQIFIDCQ